MKTWPRKREEICGSEMPWPHSRCHGVRWWTQLRPDENSGRPDTESSAASFTVYGHSVEKGSQSYVWCQSIILSVYQMVSGYRIILSDSTLPCPLLCVLFIICHSPDKVSLKLFFPSQWEVLTTSYESSNTSWCYTNFLFYPGLFSFRAYDSTGIIELFQNFAGKLH